MLFGNPQKSTHTHTHTHTSSALPGLNQFIDANSTDQTQKAFGLFSFLKIN